jgi:NADH dehydrogenase
MATPRIVVLGAGYAGLTASKLLAKRTGATVTLVNNRDRFVHRMRNFQLAAGREPRHMPLHDLVKGTGIKLVVDHVTRIDPERRRVELAGGAEPLDYDLLVNALGSHADLDAVPGAAEHAYAVGNVEHAERLRDRMLTASTLAVVGGGPTGLESVTELAEAYPDRTVKLITRGELGEMLTDRGRDYLHRTLDRFGIQILEHAKVAKVGADGLLLEGSAHVDADTVAWTTGFQVPKVARESGVATDDRGRMLVDATMRSVSHPEVYGTGDVAATLTQDGQVLRMGCGPAGLAAVCAFHAIADRLAGRTPKPLRPKNDGMHIALGERDGILQFTDLDGSPTGKLRTGRTIGQFKQAVLRTNELGMRYPAIALYGSAGRA